VPKFGEPSIAARLVHPARKPGNSDNGHKSKQSLRPAVTQPPLTRPKPRMNRMSGAALAKLGEGDGDGVDRPRTVG